MGMLILTGTLVPGPWFAENAREPQALKEEDIVMRNQVPGEWKNGRKDELEYTGRQITLC